MLIEVAAIAFAIVFFLVGIFRTVEFSGLEMPQGRRWLLVGLHILGCLLFSSSLVLVTLDLHDKHRTLVFILFITALLSLAPGQITIGILRRREAEK